MKEKFKIYSIKFFEISWMIFCALFFLYLMYFLIKNYGMMVLIISILGGLYQSIMVYKKTKIIFESLKGFFLGAVIGFGISAGLGLVLSLLSSDTYIDCSPGVPLRYC